MIDVNSSIAEELLEITWFEMKNRERIMCKMKLQRRLINDDALSENLIIYLIWWLSYIFHSVFRYWQSDIPP